MPASGPGSPARAPPPAEEEEEPGGTHEALELGLSLGVGAAAREVPALPVLRVVQVASSSSGGEEAEAGGDEEAEGPSLPSCPVCMSAWTADGEHRVR
jgi:E3 ubiquitin-protein ligase RFWD3